jgi:hypothetical protein
MRSLRMFPLADKETWFPRTAVVNSNDVFFTFIGKRSNSLNSVLFTMYDLLLYKNSIKCQSFLITKCEAVGYMNYVYHLKCEFSIFNSNSGVSNASSEISGVNKERQCNIRVV